MIRTTVTLDSDVEQLLRDVMQRRRQSFKEALNQAIRRGLSDRQTGTSEPPFAVHAHAMGGVRPGIDPLRLNQTADELEADAFATLTARLAAADRTSRRHTRK
jgi:hypothetical protein